ncbi:hypothetical protein Dsin_018695 [Dipteronia sinensis]|uniref:Uncharacterized protein n=1 Tax=Dipteronia sinensis TaxID=43782 RepID=A0AAE0A6M8_9ROSI|nr:hypothetical protein Dsin_018695 [Dipteronia sinensis]
MKRKVLRLSKSFNEIKGKNLMLTESTSKELFEDLLKSVDQSKRWKIKSSYGDIGLTYRDNDDIAYVASRMPAVYSACFQVLREVRRRLPGFSPAKVLDFGAGTGSAFWALQEVRPGSLEKVNIMEPSQSMQRAAEYCLPLVRVGGLFFAAKGHDPQEEVRNAERAVQLMGASLLQLCSVENVSLWMKLRIFLSGEKTSCMFLLQVYTCINVIKSRGKNIDVALMTKGDGLKQLEEAKIDAIVTEIEVEKVAAVEAAKKGPPKET